MKKILLFTLLSLLLSNAFAQQAPDPGKQSAVDSIMQLVNQSLARLNLELQKLDSMHVSVPLQRIERQVIITNDGDNDSMETNISNWKIEIGDDGDSTEAEAKAGVKVIK